MKTSIQSNTIRVALLLLLAVLAIGQRAQAQTLLLQLKAANYNPTTGLWTATVGANAQAGGTYPTLTASASPNGSPAVVFNGANYLNLASSIATANGYTAFAYIKPATGAGPYALFGGATGAFEYRINSGKQDALKQSTTDLGSETTTLSTSAFSLIDVTVTNVGGGGFRLNGAADGNTTASSFSAAISAIGARASGTSQENFSGSICEIDIYSGVLTPTQITNVEAALTAANVSASAAPVVYAPTTANPSPATAGGNETFFASFAGTPPIGYQWQFSTSSSGSGAANLAGATNATLVLTNIQTANNGYYSLLATNTVSPYSANSSWVQLSVQPLTPLVQLMSTNYNSSSGVWTDSSGNGNNATYGVVVSGSLVLPTLASFVTPNGSSAVNITAANGSFVLASSLAQGNGYTVFAYVEPASVAGGARHSLTGGSASGALEYDFYNGNQDYLVEYTTDVGHGNATVSTSSFSLVDLAVNSSGAAFRWNGSSDDSVAGATFTVPLTRIGNNHGGGDGYSGQIAEIDIFSGALNFNQITNIEGQLTARYVTAGSISIGPATVAPTNSVYAGNAVTLAAPVIGATGTTTYRWQTDNGSGGTSFANISGAATTNYVLSTSGLLGTYEYQLIGTPFGGTSITSAPVTLTVLAASAPVVLTDTTANPSGTTVGGNETFSASFAGNLPINYQWQVSPNASGSGAVNIAGATNTTLILTNLQLTNSAYYYSLQASNMIAPYLANSSWLQLSVQPLSSLLQVQLVATNYNPATGLWTDSSGNNNNAQASGTYPTLVTSVTSNGLPAVVFSGPNQLTLATTIAAGNSYTAFAYLKPGTNAGNLALFGGSSGAFEYRLSGGKQDVLLQQTTDLGSSTTTIATNVLSLIDVTVSSTGGGAFRLNQVADGTNAASAFTAGINAIGARNTTGTEYFVGQICEIDIYNGVLTPTQINTVEAAITNSYITPIPSAPVLVTDTTANPSIATVGGNDTFSAAFVGNLPIGYQWQVSPNASGSGAVNLAGATNATLVLSNLQLTNSGYYYSLQASNAVAPHLANSSWLQLSVQPLTALVQLIATNYDPVAGVWTDSSGNGNNAQYGVVASGSLVLPSLVSFVTPNGSAAVNITAGNGSFALTSALAQGIGYTVFAYVMPTNTSGRHALTGGSSSGALEYDIYNGNQDYLTEYTLDVGHGTANIFTTNFSLVDLAVNASGGAFRLNGAVDANVAGATFGSTITRVCNNEGGGDGLVGEVAEIDIYNGVLTPIQITNVESQLMANYVTANSIIIGAATVAPTNNTYAGNTVTLGAPVIGATGTTTYRWQTDNGSGGASFANISGATGTNYLLNTTGLQGTYEYQLIGTPFGGSSITSAPVTLTVQAASAPVVLTDTTANPNGTTVGGNETFSAAFVGNLPISYQWQVSPNASSSGAVNLAGATNTTLLLSNLQLTNSGYYYSLQASNAIAPHLANSSWLQLSVQPLTALVQLIATNYDPVAGLWTDSSGNGNNAQYGVVVSGALVLPTLNSLATPNGSPAVDFTTNNGSFALGSALDPSSGYTVIAYVEPSNISGRHALTGGPASGALEYDVYNTNQDYLIEYTLDVGHGTASIPTNSFSLMDLAVNASGSAFRLNGSSDGNVAGATFSQPITQIGNNHGGGDGFIGEISEIDIYNGVLTSLQITNIESQLTAKYVAVSSVVIGAATVAPTNNTYAGNTVTLGAPVIGATGTTTYRWQTDNGSGGASFANVSGATGTNYLLNTTGLQGTYEYQLIGTPFGGSSITSAPVTLTVQAASAPVVLTDTTANPNGTTVGGNETFSAAFVGNLPISYQWQVSPNASGSGAVNLAGATNTTLVLDNLQLTNSGYYYSLQASNAIAPKLANSSWLQLSVLPLTPLVQLQATNYEPVSGVWTDSSGNANDATYGVVVSGSLVLPTLVSSATPNGSAVVGITAGNGSFALASSLDPSSGYTVFAYVMPATVSSGSARFALTGGSSGGALEYNFYQGHQNYLIEYTGGGGAGAAAIPTAGFSLVDLAVNASGGTFRFDGAADGNVAGATFTRPITRIGNNEGGGDGLVGDVAEIDVYGGVLNSNQINNIEAQLALAYGAASTVATNPTNITAKVSGNVLQLSWPADHEGWLLQVQTNSLAQGLSPNTNAWMTVPGSASVDQTNITINPAMPAAFYRLVYP